MYNSFSSTYTYCHWTTLVAKTRMFKPKTKTELQDQDSQVQKPKAQLHNGLVQKIITHVIERFAATKMMIY